MKYLKKYWGLLLLAVIALLLSSYFRVSGRDIAGVSEISDSCTITVDKYYHLEHINRVEYTLNAEQIQQLKELILDSDFTRVLASWVQFYDKDMYDIFIDFHDGQRYISIHCIGNEYISITDQFDGKHLKIRNPDWKETLEAILAQ